MEDQLAEFLHSKKVHSPIPEIDWQAKKDEWVRSVEDLYGLVQAMLGDSIAAEDVIVRTFDVTITEDYMGTYSVPVLELRVGSERVEFRPKGVTVIGAAGRVDIRGEGDTVTLLKDMANSEDSIANAENSLARAEYSIARAEQSSACMRDRWTLVLQRIPRLTTVPLDRESLKYALERVMLPLP